VKVVSIARAPVPPEGPAGPLVARPDAAELDELALARLCRHDPATCREFFQRHGQLVFAFLFRMLGPRATVAVVEDLTQDTFLRAFEALPRFTVEGPARVSTWLLTIATRVALNELRRSRRRGEANAVAVDTVALAGGDRPDDASERSALAARLERELARLSPEHRAVFVLREYHDLGYQEIADALEIELGTVQSRLSRARAALRRALEDLR
jgi:RNA polymerase sigma-70 factor (ECF subfamily)